MAGFEPREDIGLRADPAVGAGQNGSIIAILKGMFAAVVGWVAGAAVDVTDRAARLLGTINNGAGAAAVNVQDGGNSLTVDGTVTSADNWRPRLTSDEGANDSDKVITVTAGQEWQLLNIRIELVSTATAGARQLQIDVRDGSDDVIATFLAGLTQVAQNTYLYDFGVGVMDLTAVRDGNYICSKSYSLIFQMWLRLLPTMICWSP